MSEEAAEQTAAEPVTEEVRFDEASPVTGASRIEAAYSADDL